MYNFKIWIIHRLFYYVRVKKKRFYDTNLNMINANNSRKMKTFIKVLELSWAKIQPQTISFKKNYNYTKSKCSKQMKNVTYLHSMYSFQRITHYPPLFHLPAVHAHLPVLCKQLPASFPNTHLGILQLLQRDMVNLEEHNTIRCYKNIDMCFTILQCNNSWTVIIYLF